MGLPNRSVQSTSGPESLLNVSDCGGYQERPQEGSTAHSRGRIENFRHRKSCDPVQARCLDRDVEVSDDPQTLHGTRGSDFCANL